MKRGVCAVRLLAALAAWAAPASAQLSTDDTVKIGVATDMSSLYSDINGPGAVIADADGDRRFRRHGARQEDRAGLRPTCRTRPTSPPRIAGRWYDTEKVDVILGAGASSSSIATAGVAGEKKQDLPRAPIPPRPTSPASSATPTRCTGSTTPRRSPTAPARRSSRRAARPGSSSPPTTPSATRCSATSPTSSPRPAARCWASVRAPDQHQRLLVVPAAGAGLQGAGHRPRQCRRRHDQLDQAGGRVRHRQGRPEARRPAGLRHRRALARPRARPGPATSPRRSTGT